MTAEPTIDGSARIIRGIDVAAHELGGGEGGVLLHLKSGQYHGIDTVGWAIWNLLDGARSLDEIAEALRAQYPDAPGRVGHDVVSFVQGLLDRGLVRIATPPGDAGA